MPNWVFERRKENNNNINFANLYRNSENLKAKIDFTRLFFQNSNNQNGEFSMPMAYNLTSIAKIFSTHNPQ